MRKIFILVVLIILITIFIKAEKMAVFQDLVKPDFLFVGKNHLYIVQGVQVFIYSSTDFKLIKKIGKSGEGPQEFKKMPAPWLPSLFMYLKPDQIFINSIGKVTLLTRAGEFIKEIKTNTMMSNLSHFIPMGKKYIGTGVIQENKRIYLTINLHDSNFKMKREIYRMKLPYQQGKKLNPIIMAGIKNFFTLYSYQNQIFIPDNDGSFHIFDKNGEQVNSVKYHYKKVKVTNSTIKQYEDFFKSDNRYKNIYEQDKDRIVYPDYFPIIKAYRIQGGKIYVSTHQREAKTYKTYIFTTTGGLLKETFLPLFEKNLLELFPFTIYNEKIYQIIENEDENWELHITKIK